jgi:hypothetical protein
VVRVTRALSLGSSWAAVIAAALGAAGCNSASNPESYTPITGIEIEPSSLLQGLQCGTGPNDLYQYVAVVWDDVNGGPSAQPLASNVFDCFATGVFENLPTEDGGPKESCRGRELRRGKQSAVGDHMQRDAAARRTGHRRLPTARACRACRARRARQRLRGRLKGGRRVAAATAGH